MKILERQTRSPRLKQNENPRMAHPIFFIGPKPKIAKNRVTCLIAPVKGTLASNFREMLRNPFAPVNNIHLFKLLIH